MKIKLSMLLQMLEPFRHNSLISMGSGCINGEWYWLIKTKDEHGYEHEIYVPMYDEEE